MENQFEVQRSLGRIEGGVSEIKHSIGLMRTDHALLRSEFNKLEAGRLTRLESDFAIHQAELHIKSRQTAILFSAITSIIISIVTAAIIYYLGI